MGELFLEGKMNGLGSMEDFAEANGKKKKNGCGLRSRIVVVQPSWGLENANNVISSRMVHGAAVLDVDTAAMVGLA